ncbi:MAG TPA: amidohydrolase [Chloroflexota bacterium]|nr:amidohydrolase [Chloroflexota bacterium]
MLIKNGLVLRPDGTAERIDIRVENGRIVEMGQIEGDSPVLDARDRLVAPGLINTHCHSNENYFKGLFDNLPLELWLLFSYPVLAAPPQNPRQIYIRTMLGCIEMLKTGCTAVVDFLYEMPEVTEESIAAVLQAYADSGMRVLLCIGYADKVYYETTPLAMDLLTPELKAQIDATPLLSPEENISFVDAVRGTWHGRENRIAIGLGPSGPQRCSDGQLELSAAYAAEHDLCIHIHTLETKMQAYTGRLYYGKTIVEHLSDLDFLSPRVNLNHAIWLTERDIDLIAASGAGTTHNLLSNFKLGSGISPVPEMRAKGINVSLGTDGKSSNDSQDMYEVLKAVALLHKTQLPEFRNWLGAPEAWQMATIAGAQSIGMAGETGEISVGRRADLVLFDLNTIPFTPLNNPLHQLVYCLPGHVVRTVLVEGEIVVDDGRLTRIDEEALLAEGRELGREMVASNEPAFELARALFPSVAGGYRHAVAQDVGINRYLRPQGVGHG